MRTLAIPQHRPVIPSPPVTAPLVLRGCRRYDALDDALVDLEILGGRITRIAPTLTSGAEAGIQDVGGRTVLPGLIDLHIHGAGGADVSDGTPEALRTISRTLARLGTTSFLATTLARTERGLDHLDVAAAAVDADLGGARMLGLYLEGPFINEQKRGGIPANGVAAASGRLLDEILARTAGTLRIMTVAPELDGVLALVEHLDARGVLPALGHSAAGDEEARAGFAAGIRHVTHLFNAMASLHHRAPGPLPAIVEHADVTVELIGDGVHVHPAVVALAFRILGDRLIPITDGMLATGLPEGPFRYNGRSANAARGTARYDDGTLIGTTLSLIEVMHRTARYARLPFSALVDASAATAAAVLGMPPRRLAVGAPADLVLLNEEGSVAATIVEGSVVYEESESRARS